MDANDNEQEIAPPPLPELVEPDDFKSLELIDDSTVDSARVGSRIYISVKSVCIFLGITTNNQVAKIRSKPILAQGIKRIKMPSKGGPQDTICLDFDVFPLWLLDIHPTKTKAHLRQVIFDTQVQISRIVRDMYYAYVLAQVNPDYDYIIRLLEQILAKVRTDVENTGELGHAMTMVMQMIGGQRATDTPALPAPQGKPMLRLVGGSQVVEETGQPALGDIIIPDRYQGKGDVALTFDDDAHEIVLIGADSQQVPLNPEQALQMLSNLEERRGWLLQQYYEKTSRR